MTRSHTIISAQAISEIEVTPLPAPNAAASLAAEANPAAALSPAQANPVDQAAPVNAAPVNAEPEHAEPENVAAENQPDQGDGEQVEPQAELISFVERARNDMAAYQLLLRTRVGVGFSVYANRMQLVNMITRAADKSSATQCDYELKSAYEHASQVILAGWVRTESNFRNIISNTLRDLAAGRIHFHSAKDQQHSDTVDTLRNQMAFLSVDVFEREQLVQELRVQNKKIWMQNRVLHKVLSEFAKNSGVDLSIPDLGDDPNLEQAEAASGGAKPRV